MKSRSWFKLFLLFLVVSLLSGCRQRTETLLRGYAEDVVSALDLDILHEEHHVTFVPFDADEPSSRITSYYQVSQAPEEIIEKLSAIHHSDKAWSKYDRGQWIGEVPLVTEFSTPEEQKDVFRYYLPSKPGSNGIGVESRPDMDYLLICPWFGVGENTYSTVYAHAVMLSEDGVLVIVIYLSGWDRCHAQRIGRE